MHIMVDEKSSPRIGGNSHIPVRIYPSPAVDWLSPLLFSSFQSRTHATLGARDHRRTQPCRGGDKWGSIPPIRCATVRNRWNSQRLDPDSNSEDVIHRAHPQ